MIAIFSLSWVESFSALMPFLIVLLINLTNDKFRNDRKLTNIPTINRKISDINNASINDIKEIKEPIKSATTTTAVKNSSEEVKKKKSEDCENTSTTSSGSSSPSPLLTARHSISLNTENGSTPSPPDSLFTDEYHEDEDTLSLENLFPCDQSEIYASKKISFIIDELIHTEENYVNNLRKGLINYGCLQTRTDLPDALKGEEKQQQLLGNIADIAEFHEKQILPLMLRNQHDLRQLFDDLAASFDKNDFYVYVTFTMNKKNSMQLRQENREFLQNLQTEIKDKLGIDSFLVQPIQRLTRYPLLLQQFISEFYKSSISCKPVLVSVCKLETRLRRMLEVVNQAEEITTIEELGDLNLAEQSYFRKTTEFDAYHYKSRKKFRTKIFLFDRCLLCAEVRKRRLAFRYHYNWETIDLQLSSAKTVGLLLKSHTGFKEEMDLSSPEAISLKQWLRLARKIGEIARIDASERGRFTLPMDLVLGVAFAVWFIWLYF